MKTFLLWVIALALVGHLVAWIHLLPAAPAKPEPRRLTWVYDERDEVILEGDLRPDMAGFDSRNCQLKSSFWYGYRWHCYSHKGHLEEVK